jgi:hypothetical protein
MWRQEACLKGKELAMANCEMIEKCIFFNDQMANMPSTSAVYKKIFCQQDWSTCGRYLVFKAVGRENVPKDLFPNQSDRAAEIIKNLS